MSLHDLLEVDSLMDEQNYKAVDRLSVIDNNNGDYSQGHLSYQDAKTLRDKIHTPYSWSTRDSFKFAAPAGITWTGQPAVDGVCFSALGTAGVIAGVNLETADGKTIYEEKNSKMLQLYNLIRRMEQCTTSWAAGQGRYEQFAIDTQNNLKGTQIGYISTTTGAVFTAATGADAKPVLGIPDDVNFGLVQRYKWFADNTTFNSNAYYMDWEEYLREVFPFFQNCKDLLLVNIPYNLSVYLAIGNYAYMPFLVSTQGVPTITVNTNFTAADKGLSFVTTTRMNYDSITLNPDQLANFTGKVERGLTVKIPYQDFIERIYLNYSTPHGTDTAIDQLQISSNVVRPLKVTIIAVPAGQFSTKAIGYNTPSTFTTTIKRAGILINNEDYLKHRPNSLRQNWALIEENLLYKNDSDVVSPIMNYDWFLKCGQGYISFDTHRQRDVVNPLLGKSMAVSCVLNSPVSDLSDIYLLCESANRCEIYVDSQQFSISKGW